MIKKITYLLIGLLCFTLSVNGQQSKHPDNLPELDHQTLHFGYTLGLNQMDFVIKPSNMIYAFDTVFGVESKRYVGFNIAIISNLRLAEYLDLRFLPGLNFGQRDLEYKIVENNVFKVHTMRIESTLLDFPVSLKYKSKRYGNFRPYLIGGGAIRLDLAAQKKISPDERPKIRLQKFNPYYEIGLGVDFFLEYFMFAVEVKGSFGIMNNVVYDNTEFTNVYDRLNSRMLFISFHFEGGKVDGFNWFKKRR